MYSFYSHYQISLATLPVEDFTYPWYMMCLSYGKLQKCNFMNAFGKFKYFQTNSKEDLVNPYYRRNFNMRTTYVTIIIVYFDNKKIVNGEISF